MDDLQKAIALDPNQSEAYYQLALEIAGSGDIPSAIHMLEKLQTIVPNDITLSAPDKAAFITKISSTIARMKPYSK